MMPPLAQALMRCRQDNAILRQQGTSAVFGAVILGFLLGVMTSAFVVAILAYLHFILIFS